MIGFAFMFAIAFTLINSSEESGNIRSNAEVLISIQWPDEHPDDVDAIVEDPQGGLVWYHNRDSGLMHLDRDDRGVFADKMNINGKTISNPINQETVTVRKLQAGEYVVNLLHYKANYEEALNVDVEDIRSKRIYDLEKVINDPKTNPDKLDTLKKVLANTRTQYIESEATRSRTPGI